MLIIQHIYDNMNIFYYICLGKVNYWVEWRLLVFTVASSATTIPVADRLFLCRFLFFRTKMTVYIAVHSDYYHHINVISQFTRTLSKL